MSAISPTLTQKTLAWSVHALTASSALWDLLAIVAIFEARWSEALVWMVVSVVIDSIDGALARRFNTKGFASGLDGALLDNIVDYLTYVIVPALFLYQAALLPPNLATLAIAAVTLSSAYQFSQTDAKTEDHYFKGFPSYWNVLVFYLFVWQQSQMFNFILVMVCAVLVFVPIKYIYPTRTQRWRGLHLTLGALWGVINVLILIQLPTPSAWLIVASLLYAVYYAGVSLYFMFDERRANA